MAKHKMQAPNFRDKGGAREFILNNGRTYIMLKFPDGSGLVLRRTPGRGKSAAVYRQTTRQKNVCRALGCREGTSYQMIAELFRDR